MPFGSHKLSGIALEDYFDTLLQQDGCKDAWEAYTKVTTGFPQQLANGTAPLNGFRHYTLVRESYFSFQVV